MFRQSVFAAVCVSGVLSAVGCMNTNRQKDPISLSADARGQLREGEGVPRGENSLPPPQLASTPKPVKPAAYDPAATGGTGVTKENSFARTTPNAGGVIPPVKLPAPEIGGTGPFTLPVMAGASYGDPLPDTGRTSGVRGPAPLPPPPPAGVPVASPKPPAPQLGPPESEPPVQLTGGNAAIPITPPPAPPAVQPPSSANVPLPVPVLPGDPLPSPAVPVPPAPPGGGGSPIPPSVIKSPVDDPIPGLPSIKLPAAEPIRPK